MAQCRIQDHTLHGINSVVNHACRTQFRQISTDWNAVLMHDVTLPLHGCSLSSSYYKLAYKTHAVDEKCIMHLCVQLKYCSYFICGMICMREKIQFTQNATAALLHTHS